MLCLKLICMRWTGSCEEAAVLPKGKAKVGAEMFGITYMQTTYV